MQWMIFVGVLILAAVVAWDQGLFNLLVESDRSRISIVILVAFCGVSIHAATRLTVLSRELEQVNQIRRLLEEHSGKRLCLAGEAVLIDGGPTLPEGLLQNHIYHLIVKATATGRMEELPTEQTHLLEALTTRVKGAQEVGWLAADLMIKLGLLGTVVGFILMLGSVVSVEAIDITTMQAVLFRMSSGMRVALFTTVSGLIAGMLLYVQYHVVDRSADELISNITEVAEINVLPNVAAASRSQLPDLR